MERTWLETIQLLGLDLQVAWILLMLAGAGLVSLATAAVQRLSGRIGRQRRIAPNRPLDAWSTQDWGPSH
ncbi:MAG: hypothetical protein MUF57_09425 [Gammaproteobacteria bacterium]|jgi:hypothetical protein|nr:hypothetical protein [Gammaproteobacteria bacterium]